jgi:hypothetical protein
MFRFFLMLASTAVATFWSTVPMASAPRQTSVDAVYAAAVRHLEFSFGEQGGVVAAESYTQRAEPAQWMFSLPRTVNPPIRRSEERRLRSDVFITWDPARGLTEWRDVEGVDGRRVRERNDTVETLDGLGWPGLRRHADQAALDSSRFNLNPEEMPIERTLNLPLSSMTFLASVQHGEMVLTLDGKRRVHGVPGQVLRFQTRAQQRSGRSSFAPSAEGALVIDPATGAILATDVSTIANGRTGVVVHCRLEVTFRPDRELSWVPEEMTERYDILNSDGEVMGTISGRATYSNIQRFKPVKVGGPASSH